MKFDRSYFKTLWEASKVLDAQKLHFRKTDKKMVEGFIFYKSALFLFLIYRFFLSPFLKIYVFII